LVDPYRAKVIECDRLEELAARAEEARIRRDHKDGLGTLPFDDIQSNIAVAVDCMNRAGDRRNRIRVVLVRYPELPAKGPEAARHDNWVLKVGRLPVRCDEADILDRPVPMNFPDAAAAFTCHEQVKIKCAFMIERNASMIARGRAA